MPGTRHPARGYRAAAVPYGHTRHDGVARVGGDVVLGAYVHGQDLVIDGGVVATVSGPTV